MSELSLSKDIRQIDFEIEQYKQSIGSSIWEIGRRLNHVKEHNLVHGEFIEWVESHDFNYKTANRFMRIARELPNIPTLGNLGKTALDLIASLPEQEKQQEIEKVERGEQSTVRELRELKKQLKQKDEQISALEQAVEDVEPQVIEREVVKKEVPADYERIKRENERFNQQINEMQGRTNYLKQELERLTAEREEVDEKSRKYDELNEAIQKMQGQLDEGQQKIAAQKEVYELVEKAKELIKEVSPLTYLIDAEHIIENDYARKPLVDIANKLHDIADNIERQIDEPTIIQ